MNEPLLRRDVRLCGGPHDGKIVQVPYGQRVIPMPSPSLHEMRGLDGVAVDTEQHPVLTYAQSLERDVMQRPIYVFQNV